MASKQPPVGQARQECRHAAASNRRAKPPRRQFITARPSEQRRRAMSHHTVRISLQAMTDARSFTVAIARQWPSYCTGVTRSIAVNVVTASEHDHDKGEDGDWPKQRVAMSAARSITPHLSPSDRWVDHWPDQWLQQPHPAQLVLPACRLQRGQRAWLRAPPPQRLVESPAFFCCSCNFDLARLSATEKFSISCSS